MIHALAGSLRVLVIALFEEYVAPNVSKRKTPKP